MAADLPELAGPAAATGHPDVGGDGFSKPLSKRRRIVRAQRADDTGLLCDNCGATLPETRQRFCTDLCRTRMHNYINSRLASARKRGVHGRELELLRRRLQLPRHDKGLPLADEDIPRSFLSKRRGHYVDILNAGYFAAIRDGDVSQSEVARLLGISQGAVSKAYKDWQEDVAAYQNHTVQLPDHLAMPRPTVDNVPELVEHFRAFRTTYFQTPDGKPYLLPPFQARWLADILAAYFVGGKLEILSPPRHGKTELLAHVCVWLIVCVNPNVRIMIVGGNEDIASNLVGMVRDQLDDNPTLLDDFGQGSQKFRPAFKSGDAWTNRKFTVATRTIPGIKSPTMIAVGRGGKILSRDADLIVCDDIEDNDSTYSESAREKTRRWWAITLMSRKEASTGLVVIGSRQHPDDMYGHLLTDDSWNHVVEQMHDQGCGLPDDDTAAHINCMLWPEIRDYTYMLGLLRDPIVRTQFKMVYLNLPQDVEVSTFPADLIDSCRDPSRPTGAWPDRPSVRLIAGMDPAGTGYQAVFLWAVDQETGQRFAVDFENRLGGGLQRAREQVDKWLTKYQCRHWVIESNLFHGAIEMDEILREYCQQHSITVEAHHTYGNKWDPQLGVSVLATHMQANLISIPWQTIDDESQWREYRRQLMNFSRQSTRRSKSDIVMASWFPEARIINWVETWGEAMAEEWDDDVYPFDPLLYIPA